MANQNRHKWLKEYKVSPWRLIMVKLLYLLLCAGVFCLLVRPQRLFDKAGNESADNIPEIIIEEQTPEEERQLDMSFEEYCRLNPISLCWDNSQATDFMYASENDKTAIMPNEEFSPELLEKAAQLPSPETIRYLAEQIEAQNLLPDSPQSAQLFAEVQRLNQDILDEIYEEELPEDIIDRGVIANTKLKGKSFVPDHKPPYFGEKPVIAIVIDDMGVSPRRTANIASLQAPLTASFLTYGRNLERQIENSKRSGQEIIIHVPMEAQKNVDAAPDVLTTAMTTDEIKDNLKIMLAKFKNVRGINNHMGSKLTEDKERMAAVMQVLKEHDMFFLDSKTSAKSKAEDAAAEAGLAYAHRHVFIDNNNDKTYILNQLAKAENIARKNGYAIAIGHPKTQTFAALQEWLDTLPDKKLKLVHLSDIIQALNP